MKMTYKRKSFPFVEEYAIISQIRVIRTIRISYAGTHAIKSALAQFTLSYIVKHTAHTHISSIAIYVDTCLHRPFEGFASLEF